MTESNQTAGTYWWCLLSVSLLAGSAGCMGLDSARKPVADSASKPLEAVERFSATASAVPVNGGRRASPAAASISDRRAKPKIAPSTSKPDWKATGSVVTVAHQEPALLPPSPEKADVDDVENAPEAFEAPQAGAAAAPLAVDLPEAPESLPSHALNLSTALQLIGGQSPAVAFAHQRIVEAEARLDGAQALWLPSIRGGVSFHRHDGNLQASNGAIQDVNRSSLQAGLGVNAVGAGTTPVPGVVAQFHLSDAFFQPQVAERTLAARNFGSWVTYHDEMLRAAEAYLELLRAAQEKAIADETLANSTDLVRLTSAFAESGQGAQADADRAATERAIRLNELARAEEAVEVASARVVEVLHLDAPLHVVPSELHVIPIELVSAAPSAQSLVATGLSSRPELGESRQLVEAACEQLRREQFAPLMPSVLLGMSYGEFGGGLGRNIGSVDDRLDVDLSAVWELRNFGLGDAAAQKAAQARVDQARFQQIQIMDRVAREIVASRAQVRARERQIATAEAAVSSAQQAFERDRQRINEGQGLPLEALQSLQALDRSRREYLRTIIDFNIAQFRLHHAIGWPD